MKKNLKLLHQYRNKMAWMLATVITMLVGLGIIVASFLVFMNSSASENSALKIKFERVRNINLIHEVVIPENRPKISKITENSITDSRIYSGADLLYDNMKDLPADYVFPRQSIFQLGDYKYYSSASLGKDGTPYTVIVRIPSSIFEEWIFSLFVYTTMALIPVFFLVLFISYKIVDLLFHPAQDIVSNLEDFASNVNHEFKTSLAETISSLELAEVTSNYKEGVHNAIVASRRINGILDSLGHTIHFVNSDYRRERTDLVAMIEKSLIEFKSHISEKNITLTKLYNPRSHIARMIDHEPLLLCFRNIFKNAVRYSHEGGEIELSITNTTITVKDYGIGIEKENLSKVFGRYFREDYAREGSGIGLALVKKIADRYGWKIHLESEKGEYTSVTISF